MTNKDFNAAARIVAMLGDIDTKTKSKIDSILLETSEKYDKERFWKKVEQEKIPMQAETNKDTILHIIPAIPKYEESIESIDDTELDNAAEWYLHGELESIVGYDKGVMTNCKTLGLKRRYKIPNEESRSKLHIDGEYKCTVEGIDKPCTAFMYTYGEYKDNWVQRGLVCLSDDADACNYARNMMEKKSLIL
jgi:hypothetical protein